MSVFREDGSTGTSGSLDGESGSVRDAKGVSAKEKGGGHGMASESKQTQILVLQMVLKVSKPTTELCRGIVMNFSTSR